MNINPNRLSSFQFNSAHFNLTQFYSVQFSSVHFIKSISNSKYKQLATFSLGHKTIFLVVNIVSKSMLRSLMLSGPVSFYSMLAAKKKKIVEYCGKAVMRKHWRSKKKRW